MIRRLWASLRAPLTRRETILYMIFAGLVFVHDAVRADTWTGKDKQDHFAGSAILGMGASQVFDNKLQAFGAVLLVGAAKEGYDYKHPQNHTASWKDFAADAAGAVVGVYYGGCILRQRSILCGVQF